MHKRDIFCEPVTQSVEITVNFLHFSFLPFASLSVYISMYICFTQTHVKLSFAYDHHVEAVIRLTALILATHLSEPRDNVTKLSMFAATHLLPHP